MRVLKHLAFLFMLLSFLGLWQSLSFHVNLLMPTVGSQQELGWLDTGIFIVWLPAILTARHICRGKNRGDWQTIFRHCPACINFGAQGLIVYAIVNGLYSMVSLFTSTKSWDYWHLRMGSGSTIMFYGVAAFIFYTFLQD